MTRSLKWKNYEKQCALTKTEWTNGLSLPVDEFYEHSDRCFPRAIDPAGKSIAHKQQESTFLNSELKFKATLLFAADGMVYLPAINRRTPQYSPQHTMNVEDDNEKIASWLINISAPFKLK